MFASVEGETAAVVAKQPRVKRSTAEQAVKPAKEKKMNAPKEKSRSTKGKASQPSHPTYLQMIKEALLALHDKSGSSPYAIAKFMEDKHKAVLPANFRKMLALQLKNCVAKGTLIKIKASFKLSESGKKEKVGKGAKTDAEKKAKVPKSKSGGDAPKSAKIAKKSETQKRKPSKNVAANKAKKSTPSKPKQPKSIKSPKKFRRATAALAKE